MEWTQSGNFGDKPRRPRTLDVDGTIAAAFGLENGGVLPAPVPLREAVGLLVDAWDEAADWSRIEAEAEPRERGAAADGLAPAPRAAALLARVLGDHPRLPRGPPPAAAAEALRALRRRLTSDRRPTHGDETNFFS